MKIIAIDYGEVRTGLAISDITEQLASPLEVIIEKNYKALTKKISNIVTQTGAELIIIGRPLNMYGTAGERALKSEKLARFLKKFVDANVILWDERLSTVEASGYLKETKNLGRRRKENIDKSAAAVILQSYLNYRKNQSKMD